MEKKMYSASEIAAMGLPGMPTSRDNVRIRAEKEHWPAEEQKGVGGTRKVYEIPAHYLDSQTQVVSEDGAAAPAKAAKGSGNVVVLDSARKQQERMLEIGRAVDQWLLESNLVMDLDKKYTLIDLLYKYFEREKLIDNDKLTDILRKMA